MDRNRCDRRFPFAADESCDGGLDEFRTKPELAKDILADMIAHDTFFTGGFPMLGP